jgi:hypothetical protein
VPGYFPRFIARFASQRDWHVLNCLPTPTLIVQWSKHDFCFFCAETSVDPLVTEFADMANDASISEMKTKASFCIIILRRRRRSRAQSVVALKA